MLNQLFPIGHHCNTLHLFFSKGSDMLWSSSNTTHDGSVDHSPQKHPKPTGPLKEYHGQSWLYTFICLICFLILEMLRFTYPLFTAKKQHTQMSYLQNSFDLYSIPIHIPYIDLSGGNPNVFFKRESSWKNQLGDGFPTCRNWFTRIHPPPPGLRL